MLYTTENKTEWEGYIERAPQVTFFHQLGWERVIEKTFGYKPHYLISKRNGKIDGILPLFEVTSLLSGKAFISLPFAIYGGVCADNNEIACALIQEAVQIAENNDGKYLELRNLAKDDGVPAKELYSTFIKELPADPKQCLEDLPRKARAAARKGIDSGLKAEIGLHNLDAFYRLYSISVRNLGSPVFPKRFLTNLIDEFKDKVNILTVKYNDIPVASVFTLFYRDIVMPYYAGSLSEYFRYQINNFMYLKLMEYGVEKGYRYFDFGRSKKGTGAYEFKKFNGFEPKQLYYQYYFNKSTELPNLSPVNPKLSMAIKIWRRLPVFVANFVGSRIIKFTPP